MIEKFAAPGLSLFGEGSLEEAVPYLQREGIKKALVVTDPSIRRLGLLKPVERMLEKAGAEMVIFDQVMSNPTIENVEEGTKLMKENHCDAIVAVGGGSPNDCAKAIGILEANGGGIRDYVGGNKAKVKGKYLVAVNTTAGTGSEVSRAYLISDEKAKTKLIFKDDYAMPDLAINDLQLTLGLPGAITAQTGMDALTHAMEAYISKGKFQLTDMLAIDGIRLIFANLEKAVKCPGDREARANMSLGQYLAGLSFGSAGLGLAHAMAHQLGAVYHLPHGLANAVLLPAVMEYEYPWCIPQFSQIAQALDHKACEGKSEKEKARLAIDWVEGLSQRVGTKICLKELGARREDLPMLASKALEDGCISTAPKIPNEDEIIEIFERVMGE